MKLINALKRDEDDLIIIPIAAIDIEGNHIEGRTTDEYLNNAFTDFVNLDVPLLEVEYQSLLDNSSENWKLNWKTFREQGVI